MFLVGILLQLCSAWWPLQLGFLSCLAIGWCLWKPVRSWQEGVLGSTILWVGYLYWIVPFLKLQLGASTAGASILGLLLLSYFFISTALIWWVLWSLSAYLSGFSRWRSGVICSVYLWWAMAASLPFMSCMSGYFFLNPLLPAVAWARESLSFVIPPKKWLVIPIGDVKIACYFLPPPVDYSRAALTQKLYKDLYAAPQASSNESYILSPESTFPFSLPAFGAPEFQLWQSVLPANTTWIMGGVRSVEGGTTQALYYLQKGLITDVYEKYSLIDLFESPPASFFQRACVRCFSLGHETFVPGLQVPQDKGKIFQPALCSDLFSLVPNYTKRAVLLAVNETWLPPWMKLIWQGYALYWSYRNGMRLLWVGHTECRMSSLL